MSKNQQQFVKIILYLIDMLVTVMSFFVAYWFRDFFFENTYGNLQGMHMYLWMLFVIIPVWSVLFIFLRVYEIKLNIKVKNILKSIVRLLPAVIIGDLLLASIFYFTNMISISRLFFIIFAVINFLMLWIDKIIVQFVWSSIAKDKLKYQQVLVIGTGDRNHYTEYVNVNPDLMINIAGYVLLGEKPFPSYKKVLGTIDNLAQILKDNVIDEVVFNAPYEYMPDIEKLMYLCEDMGITVRMAMRVGKVAAAKTELSMMGDIPMVAFHTVDFSPLQSFLKRCMDIAGSLVGLLITGILFPFIALAIKLDSEGPILFGQYRMGKNGRKFKFYKFRSMYIDAEERKKELMAKNEMKGFMFKMTDDPRITKVGKFLRKTSLDELPQFWNILMGDMSLVGTRPPTMDEVVNYDVHHWKRLSIKPGLTGMWQVSGRSDITDFDEVVRLDSEYIDNWSIWLDIKILFKTVLVVFERKGSK